MILSGNEDSAYSPGTDGFAIIGYMVHSNMEKKKTKRTFIAYIESDPETGLYMGSVPGIPGAHTQGTTMEELKRNLKEVIELCLEETGETERYYPEFIGVKQAEIWHDR